MPGAGDFGTLENNMIPRVFHPVIREWFQANYKSITPPQEKGWPVIANGCHTLILAPTGSGKTLAAFLWCIDHLFQLSLTCAADLFVKNPDGIHTLYVSPLKALNNDIERNLRVPLTGIARHAQQQGLYAPAIRVQVRTGDTSQQQRREMLRKPPHILITTPESLYLLITSKSGRNLFSHLRYLIVDEIHAISDNKRGVHLSLTLERLMKLCRQEPIRIGLSATQKPLNRIAAYLGGWWYDQSLGDYRRREVTIVNCSERKKINLCVKSPVADFSDLPESTVWPQTIKLLYDEIIVHRTTLIFVNMRAQAERIARQLNERHQRETGDPKAEIALAHHGSISREMRFDIEARLKNGKIPAVVATGSLELGIDIGSIDLVIQLGSPRTVAGAIQRIGRSGHLYQAESKGYIIPLYPADLDDAIALSKAIQEGAIEETVIPENCLDVLAQQLVAEISVNAWQRYDLYTLIRQSYCYQHLSQTVFNHVLEMLSGSYAGSRLPGLQARITWDRVNDRLIPRAGSAMVAIMNGGTIPDRGYYGVYLKGNNTRLGEVEEEFVFESRVGDTFFLGNHEWIIDAIGANRIVVAPIQAIKPKAPFWKGGLAYRDYATAEKIGQFREALTAQLEQKSVNQWLHAYCSADDATIENIINYFRRQITATGKVATHRQLVAEIFKDSSGETNLVIHAPFGTKVNATWSLILVAILEKKFHHQVQYTYNDDGILLRMGDQAADFPIKELLLISPEEAHRYLLTQLPASYLFAVMFRYNAMRALLLPRSQPNKRIPLWIQRLKAADLLQVVNSYPDFPIIVETYRECLHDIFNVHALEQVLSGLARGEILLHVVHSAKPSPMTSGLVFNFLSLEMYDYDRLRAPAEAAAVSSSLLAELIHKKEVPPILNPDLIQSYESRTQYLTPQSRTRDVEGLYEIIERLGPLTYEELNRRCERDPADWLNTLQANNRIIKRPEGYLITDVDRFYSQADGKERAKRQVRMFMQMHGPLTKAQISTRTKIPQVELTAVLEELAQQQLLIKGFFIEGSEQEQWCDRNTLAQLYRQAVVVRRQQIEALPFKLFYKFQFYWHKLVHSKQPLRAVLDRYRGFHLPFGVWEREIFPPRLSADFIDEIKRLTAAGEIILRHPQESGCLTFHLRSEGNLFFAPSEGADDSYYNFIKNNNGCFFQDIINGLNQGPDEVVQGLYSLLVKDKITCDNYEGFKYLLADYQQQRQGTAGMRRRKIEQKIQGRMKLNHGRWYTTNAFTISGKAQTPEEQAEAITDVLLQRYGILVKEWYRRENLPLPWYHIFQILKRREWQGKIRRGYFIAGLSGIQYAMPEAVTLLADIQRGNSDAVNRTMLISVLDPCLPLGGHVAWHLVNQKQEAIPVVRSAGNHLILSDGIPVAYTENWGARLLTLSDSSPENYRPIAKALKQLLIVPAALRARSKIEIAIIDGEPAVTSPMAAELRVQGFEQNGTAMRLWPSAL
jgi:ATP-dependent Lhr-like helicase